MRICIVTLIFLLSLTSLAFADEVIDESTTAVEADELTTEAVAEQPSNSSKNSRMSDLIKSSQGVKEIKPINLDEMGDKMLELGDKSYGLLQKGSSPMLIWGIGISVVIMLAGIILGKAAVIAGFTGLVISFVVFIIIQFAPEGAEGLIQGVSNFFGE